MPSSPQIIDTSPSHAVVPGSHSRQPMSSAHAASQVSSPEKPPIPSQVLATSPSHTTVPIGHCPPVVPLVVAVASPVLVLSVSTGDVVGTSVVVPVSPWVSLIDPLP